MKVFELLNFINKKRYKLVFGDTGKTLPGGVFSQKELDIEILNLEVKDYAVYFDLRKIIIYIK